MKSLLILNILWLVYSPIQCKLEGNKKEVMLFSSCQVMKNSYMVEIEETEQELMLDEAYVKCFQLLLQTPRNISRPPTCLPTWDTVLCWPEAPINSSVKLQCPNYINKFNKKNVAVKNCSVNSNTSKPEWSLTDYSQCFEQILCTDTKCSIEHHVKYIILMRVVGYMASLLSLALSIFILLKPKLQCPRNFVHINLFIAFSLRTILTVLVDTIVNVQYSTEDVNDSLLRNYSEKLLTDALPEFFFCKILVSLFFYSGSVFTVAISAEALYLVLLLEYPFYSEQKGSIFCIVLSWVLPVFWMGPWVLMRALYHNFWCWQTESDWNLIIKIPHSLLLIMNICCATFIFRVLYSQTMSRSMATPELAVNIKKYRNLAKSILILIPIFGLHFIFFAWLPYAKAMNINIGPCIEICIIYIEIFFNAFQGLAVAITCCLKHREVRIEFLLTARNLFKKFQCSNKSLDSDYLSQLRSGNSTKTEKRILLVKNKSLRTSILESSPEAKIEMSYLATANNQNKPVCLKNIKKSTRSQSLYDMNTARASMEPERRSLNNGPLRKFLFGNIRNDFFSSTNIGSQTNQCPAKETEPFIYKVRI